MIEIFCLFINFMHNVFRGIPVHPFKRKSAAVGRKIRAQDREIKHIENCFIAEATVEAIRKRRKI